MDIFPRTRASTRGKAASGAGTQKQAKAQAQYKPPKKPPSTSLKTVGSDSSKKAGSKSTKKFVRARLAVPHPTPERWQEVYDAIKEMRSKYVAPVDTMGCHIAQRHETDPKNKRFITLVSLMLSSQTTDQVVDAAVIKLRDAVGGTMSVDALLAASDAAIFGAISSCGFCNKKTDYLRRAAQMLKDDFDSDVPKTIDELVQLPGVGEKMGFLCLRAAWKINAGIGVDVLVTAKSLRTPRRAASGNQRGLASNS